jgi:hypothetical protein
VVPMDEEVPPRATFAFSWLSGLLLYGTPNDDRRAASDTWVLTHPDLRLTTALSAGVGVDEAPARELVQDGETIEHEMWARFVPGLMAHLRGLLPEGLSHSRPYTALRHAFPEGITTRRSCSSPACGAKSHTSGRSSLALRLRAIPARGAW